MKGRGIQVTNKAYRDGWERTFRKDSEIPSLLDSVFETNHFISEGAFNQDNHHLADFVALRKAMGPPTERVLEALMEAWIRQLPAELHDDSVERPLYQTQDERK